MADFIEKTLIAVASEDGKNVNRHFGKAEKFYIYESAEDEINFIEIRNVSPGCSGCGNHNDSKIEANLEVIKDCDNLFGEDFVSGFNKFAFFLQFCCIFKI